MSTLHEISRDSFSGILLPFLWHSLDTLSPPPEPPKFSTKQCLPCTAWPPSLAWALLSSQAQPLPPWNRNSPARNCNQKRGTRTLQKPPAAFSSYRRSFWENPIYFLHPGRNNCEFWRLWTSQFFPCSFVTPGSTWAFSLQFKKINWNLNIFFYPPKIFKSFKIEITLEQKTSIFHLTLQKWV